MAFDLSARLGLCPAADAETRAPPPRLGRAAGRACASIGGDKPPALGGQAACSSICTATRKAESGKLTFVLVRGIGKAFCQPARVDERTPWRAARRRHRRLTGMEADFHFEAAAAPRLAAGPALPAAGCLHVSG